MRRNFLIITSGYMFARDLWIIDGDDSGATKFVRQRGVPESFFRDAQIGDVCNFDNDMVIMRVGRQWSTLDDCWLE